MKVDLYARTQLQQGINNCFVQVLDLVVQYYTGRKMPESHLFAAGSGMLLAYGIKNMNETAQPHFTGFSGKGFFQRSSELLGLEICLEGDPTNVLDAKERLLSCIANNYLSSFLMHEDELGNHSAFNTIRNNGSQLSNHYHHVIPIHYNNMDDQLTVWVAALQNSFDLQVDINTVAHSWVRSAALFPGSSITWEGAARTDDLDLPLSEYLKTVSMEMLESRNLHERCFTWLQPTSFGIHALEDFVKDLENWSNEATFDDRIKDVLSSFIVLKADVGYSFTQINEIVNDVYQNTNNAKLYQASQQIRKMIAEWEVVSNLFYKMSFSKQAISLAARIRVRLMQIHSSLIETLEILREH
jgi:hypothetical protein